MQIRYLSLSIFQELGAQAVITKIFHAEYAGKDVEYYWGYSKSLYRKYHLASNKGKTNVYKLVAKCISREVITKYLVRKFSRRARGYMVTYKILEDYKGNQTHISQ